MRGTESTIRGVLEGGTPKTSNAKRKKEEMASATTYRCAYEAGPWHDAALHALQTIEHRGHSQ
jgi:hypothetical protein